MDRYHTRIEGETVFIETESEPLEIGDLGEVIELVGGEEYTITYEEDYAKAVDWLDLDEDESMSFDVIETIQSMDFPASFVRALKNRPLDSGGSSEPAERTVYFATVMQSIWDSKGSLDDLEDNPFQ